MVSKSMAFRGGGDRGGVMGLAVSIDHADHHQADADQAVGDVGLVLDEGGRDQQGDHAHQQHGGDKVGDLGAGRALGDGALLLAEQEGQDQRRHHGAQLHRPEDAGTAAVEEKVQKAHVGIRAQHDGGGVAHQGGRALQVGGHRDADDKGHGVGLELFADLQGDGGHHQHGGHVVHKGRDDAGKQGQGHRGHLDVGHLLHDEVGQEGGHFAVDEQLHQAHGAGDHQQDVEVDGPQDLVEGQHPGGDKDRRRADGDVGPVFAEGQHQHVGNSEE